MPARQTAPVVLAGVGLALVLEFILCRPIAAQDAPGRKLAFLVGVKTYQHADLKNLDFPENDVEELATVLTADGFETVVLTTTRGKQHDKNRPTAANIRSRLKAILRGATKNDLIIVGLAGHGIQPLGADESYFCPSDANPVVKNDRPIEPERLVAVGEILTQMSDSGIGYKLLLVDACRNDPSARCARHRGVDHVNVSALPSQTGVLLSCSQGEFSFEEKSLTLTDGLKGHGVFFYHVIEGLKGAAKDSKSQVTWDGLGGYVRTEVPDTVQRLFGKEGGEQSPNAIGNLRGAPVALARITAPAVQPAERSTMNNTDRDASNRNNATSPAATKDGFVSLFNGTDLTGWKTHPDQPGNWRVENGVLTGSGSIVSHLYTERADFKDFHLRVEARINRFGNSGLYFRTEFGPRWPARDPKFPRGYEAQIDSTNHTAKTGSLIAITDLPNSGRAVVAVTESPVPPDRWFTMEVITKGKHIVIKVNGETTADYTDESRRYTQGRIAVQQLEIDTVAEFRKIEIKELTPLLHNDLERPFFNGQNLSGWEGLAGFWHVKNGTIVGSVPRGRKARTFLCSKAVYKDFELKFRARLADGVGNSGVQFRTRMKDRQRFTVVGPQCEIAGNNRQIIYATGSLLTEPMGKPDVPASANQVAQIFKPREFNDFEIRCVGTHVRIKLNGVTTVDEDFPSMPDEGIIAWQMHGNDAPKEVTFKDIEFTDLSNSH